MPEHISAQNAHWRGDEPDNLLFSLIAHDRVLATVNFSTHSATLAPGGPDAASLAVPYSEALFDIAEDRLGVPRLPVRTCFENGPDMRAVDRESAALHREKVPAHHESHDYLLRAASLLLSTPDELSASALWARLELTRALEDVDRLQGAWTNTAFTRLRAAAGGLAKIEGPSRDERAATRDCERAIACIAAAELAPEIAAALPKVSPDTAYWRGYAENRHHLIADGKIVAETDRDHHTIRFAPFAQPPIAVPYSVSVFDAAEERLGTSALPFEPHGPPDHEIRDRDRADALKARSATPRSTESQFCIERAERLLADSPKLSPPAKDALQLDRRALASVTASRGRWTTAALQDFYAATRALDAAAATGPEHAARLEHHRARASIQHIRTALEITQTDPSLTHAKDSDKSTDRER